MALTKGRAVCLAFSFAERIEVALAGRNHRPPKVPKCLGTSERPKGESADIAASAVGWSGEQYRQAKREEKIAILRLFAAAPLSMSVAQEKA